MASPSDQPQAPKPVRLAAVAGTVAAALLIAAFFLPFLEVDAADAGRLAEHITAETARRSVDAGIGEDFAAVFESVAAQGYMTLADVVHYARTAGPERDNVIYDGARSGSSADPAARRFERLLWILLLLAAAPPLGGLALACYFVYHGWRRARSPMLIFAFVIGVMGAAIPAAYQYARYELQPHLVPTWGFGLALAGALGLVLVAVFGVTIKNWWRVYLGGLLTLAGLAAVCLAYLNRGIAA